MTTYKKVVDLVPGDQVPITPAQRSVIEVRRTSTSFTALYDIGDPDVWNDLSGDPSIEIVPAQSPPDHATPATPPTPTPPSPPTGH